MKLCLQNHDYRVENQVPVIYLFTRDEQLQRKRVRVLNFQPFFWRPTNAVSAETVDIFEKPVERVVTRLPKDVKKIRLADDCEADVKFSDRYVISKGIVTGFAVDSTEVEDVEPVDFYVEPKRMYADFEVIGPVGILPKPQKPDHPIVSFTYCVNPEYQIALEKGVDVTVILVTQKPLFEIWERAVWYKKHYIWKRGSILVNIRVINVPSEKALVIKTIESIREEDPDILTGWFSNDFDWPYFINRSHKLGIPPIGISPLNYIRCNYVKKSETKYARRNRWDVHVHGRSCLDMMALYAKFFSSRGRQDLELKSVIKRHTGFEYKDIGWEMLETYESDIDTFIEYCIGDVLGLYLLDIELKLFDYFGRIKKKVGCAWEDTNVNSRVVDTWLLRNAGFPLPSKSHEEAFGVKGASVLKPLKGLHENVGVFDMRALYPSLILAFNISPDVKSDKGEIDAGYARFRKDKEGVMRKILKPLFVSREELRRLKEQVTPGTDEYWRIWTEEQTFKYLVNTFWGVFAYKNFRLYDPACANSVTGLGRECQNVIKTTAEENGYEVVNGDTDAVMVGMTNFEEGWELETLLSDAIAEMCEERNAIDVIQLGYEKFLRRVVFAVKKKEEWKKKSWAAYVTWENGVPCDYVQITGFPARRSDSALVTIASQREFFEWLLKEGNLKSALGTLKRRIDDFTTNTAYEISVPRGRSKPIDEYVRKDPWIRGMEYAAKHFGTQWREDVRPRLIYVHGVKHKPATHEVCILDKIPEGLIINYPKMLDKTLKAKFDGILKSLGVSWSELVTGTRQQTLDVYG